MGKTHIFLKWSIFFIVGLLVVQPPKAVCRGPDAMYENPDLTRTRCPNNGVNSLDSANTSWKISSVHMEGNDRPILYRLCLLTPADLNVELSASKC